MLGTTAGKRSRECQQFSSPCCRFVSAQLLLLFFFSPCTCFRLFESYVFSSSWLQGYGLEEGTDPCVFYTQLTKLLNLIALLGIILFCGKLTLFLLICVVFLIYLFFFFFNDKMLWDWLFSVAHVTCRTGPLVQTDSSDKKKRHVSL